MRKKYYLSTWLFLLFCIKITAQHTAIPNANFEAHLVATLDYDDTSDFTLIRNTEISNISKNIGKEQQF